MTEVTENGLERAKALFQAGLSAVQAGRLSDAEEAFRQVLALAPGRLSVLVNLGVVLFNLGKLDESVAVLEEAVALSPDAVDALGHLGIACAEGRKLTRAAEVLQRALELDPKRVSLWTCRGSVLRELGRDTDAAFCFERALELGADPALHRFYLASVSASTNSSTLPAHPPIEYVEGLFNSYSNGFEHHLAVLGYEVPGILVDAVAAIRPFPMPRCLDLGCGTGLIAKHIRELEQHTPAPAGIPTRIDGIDVSGRMIELAARSGAYDGLYHANLLEWLNGSWQPYQAVFAADVFIYVGALEEVFSGVAALLPPGGLFAFSVEALGEGETGYRLMPSLRYAHSWSYLEGLALRNALETVEVRKGIIRHEQSHPVDGLFVFLRRI